VAEPLIFIGTYTIKEGKLEEFKQYCGELCKLLEENEPRLIHFGLYFDEDGTEVSVVQVHPDADSMEFHMQVASEHFASAFEFLDTTKSVQVYGTPSDALVGQIKQASEPGVSVIVKSELAGFNRLSAMAV
jgi:quinol monooxygenase YgiN